MSVLYGKLPGKFLSQSTMSANLCQLGAVFLTLHTPTGITHQAFGLICLFSLSFFLISSPHDGDDDDDDDIFITSIIIIIIIIIIITLKGANREFTISSLRREPSPTRTLKWPGRNCVQITCNTSGAHHVKHVVCHLVRWHSSAI